MRMKIVIEALGIQNPGGGRSATLSLLQHLFSLDRHSQYLVILSAPEPSLDLNHGAGNVRQWIAPTQNRYLSRLWLQAVLPIKLRGYDLVHFSKNLGAFFLPVPAIVTIHDLTTLVLAPFFPKTEVLYWRTVEKWTAQAARRVIVVSNCTAADVVSYFNVPASRITTIYHGRSDAFFPRSSAEVEEVRRRYHLPEEYVLTVGRIDLKKNLTTLVKAFEILKKSTPYAGKLVLAGEVYKKCEDKALVPTIQRLGLSEEVLLIGRVPDEDLPALYCGAQVSAFSSLHEGFGLVALEAMSCGTPVITHHACAVIEVVGDAAVVVDARQPQALAGALVKVLEDKTLQQDLRQRGLARAGQFSWEKSAAQLLQVYQEAVG